MHDKHQEFFDAAAAEWDLTYTAEDLERLTHIVDKLNMAEGMDILDLGCGTGILFDMLRRKVTGSGTVTGVDFSIEMARKAHRNFPFDNVNVVDADATALPFADGSFDVAVAFAAFPHFSDQQKAIDEVHRVLKSGAKFHIIHLESAREISRVHHEIGGVVAHDEIPTDTNLREMFDHSQFMSATIEDHPGLYLATAVNSR